MIMLKKELIIYIFCCLVTNTFGWVNLFKDYTVGWFTEVCTDTYIPKNFDKLVFDLQFNVFGQPIVQDEVVHALKAHYDDIENSKKALVMSFHGTPGTGKNYVASYIANAIYKEGMNSKFVHYFSGLADYSNVDHLEYLRYQIKQRVEKGVKSCPQSLFIFDEVDAMPSGVFDRITPFLDYHAKIHGVDYRKAIFIFLSNSGGIQIADKVQSLYKSLTRENLKINHFEEILEAVAYNFAGGLKDGKPIESALIDHFIPFLPLERAHVIQCIEVEFKRLKIRATEANKNDLLKQVTFDNMFAKSGCKRVVKKAEMFRRTNIKQEL